MKLVSFDFDGVLDNKYVQQYAKTLVEKGIEVHITTSRYIDSALQKIWPGENNDDIRKIAKEIGIEIKNIHFTNMQDKFKYFEIADYFAFHLDDDFIEIRLIKQNTNVPAIWVLSENWKKQCEEKLNI